MLKSLTNISCANPGIKYFHFEHLPFQLFNFEEELNDPFNDLSGLDKLRLVHVQAFRTNELPFANFFESFGQHHMLVLEVEASEPITIRYCPGISRNSLLARMKCSIWRPLLHGIDSYLTTTISFKTRQRAFLLVEWGLNDVLCFPPLAKRASLLLSFLSKKEWAEVERCYVISGSEKLDQPLSFSSRIASDIDKALSRLGFAAFLSDVLEAMSTVQDGHLYSLQPHHFTFQRFPSLEDHKSWGCLNCQQMTRLLLLALRARLGKLRAEAKGTVRAPISPLWPPTPQNDSRLQSVPSVITLATTCIFALINHFVGGFVSLGTQFRLLSTLWCVASDWTCDFSGDLVVNYRKTGSHIVPICHHCSKLARKTHIYEQRNAMKVATTAQSTQNTKKE